MCSRTTGSQLHQTYSVLRSEASSLVGARESLAWWKGEGEREGKGETRGSNICLVDELVLVVGWWVVVITVVVVAVVQVVVARSRSGNGRVRYDKMGKVTLGY